MKLYLSIFIVLLLSSCANMVAPTGGEKDIDSPEILNIIESVGKESGQLDKIYFLFDEHIALNQWEEHFYISPPIKKRIVKKIAGKSSHSSLQWQGSRHEKKINAEPMVKLSPTHQRTTRRNQIQATVPPLAAPAARRKTGPRETQTDSYGPARCFLAPW